MGNNQKLNILIVGSGQIAALYDDPKSESYLTHAHAITASSNNLLGFVDSDIQKSKKAVSIWGGKAFDSLAPALSLKPDVVVVATPDKTHVEILKKILDSEVQVVICEKPLTLNLSQAKTIVQEFADARKMLLVNFQRRYDKFNNELREKIKSGHLGSCLSGSLLYSKGIKHNGSHAIDLLRYFFGEPISCHKTSERFDYSESDPTVGGILNFKDFEIHLIPGNEQRFSIFELDLLFERRRVRFLQSGMQIEIQEVLPDPTFPGYFELMTTKRESSSLNRAMLSFYLMLPDIVSQSTTPYGTALDAIKNQEICENLAGAKI